MNENAPNTPPMAAARDQPCNDCIKRGQRSQNGEEATSAPSPGFWIDHAFSLLNQATFVMVGQNRRLWRAMRCTGSRNRAVQAGQRLPGTRTACFATDRVLAPVHRDAEAVSPHQGKLVPLCQRMDHGEVGVVLSATTREHDALGQMLDTC